MKIVNRICQILAIVFGLASLALFFMNFATVTCDGETVSFIGAQLGFGGKMKVLGETAKLAKSADILFCFVLTAIGFVLSIFGFKSKKVRYFTPAFGLASAIYMLVIALSDPNRFVDIRPLNTMFNVTKVEYSSFVLFAAIALFAFTVFAVAYLLIDDYIEVLESKGSKKTIFKRVVLFLRDYKSEAKKIVWPSFKDVLKNTLIVIIICVLVGIIIWGVDFGLGKLLELILGA